MADRAWPSRRPHSLLARVLVAVFLLLFLGGILLSLSTWFNGQQAARQAYDRILLGAASDIAESISIQNGAPVVDLPVSAFQLLAQAPDDRVYYAVRRPDGALVTGFDQDIGIAPGSAGQTGPIYFDAALQGEEARFVQIARRFAEREFSGEVLVTVGQTTQARQAMALGLMLDALVPSVLAGGALLLIAYVVMRSALRPLEALATGFRERDPYDLTPIDAKGVPRELGVVLVAMNRFMGRLERQVDAVRNLISDTAHQLRTPVASIRVQAEAIVELDDPQSRDDALNRLVGRTRSLGNLLERLLSRALVIHRTEAMSPVRFDLRDVALDVIEMRDHEALAPGQEVTLEIGDQPVIVAADPFSLGEAAKNMLDNALRHGKSPVQIGVTGQNGLAMLWVEDAGPGPDPALAARMGERFERSAGSPEGGTGIGLSIVKAVAEAFGGRVEMGRADGGFRVSLVLPAASESPELST